MIYVFFEVKEKEIELVSRENAKHYFTLVQMGTWRS